MPIRLPSEFIKAGWHYRLVTRKHQTCLFHRSRPDGSEPHYEVHRLVTSKDRTMPNGTTLPAAEHLAPSESWGSRGWTFSPQTHLDPLEAAKSRFALVIRNTRPF